MLQKIRGLLIRKGRLSETLLMKARGMPSTTTIRAHFGTFRKLYEMVGYHLDTEDILKREQCKRSLKLRRTVVHKIKEMFPEHVSVTHLPGKGRTRSMLLIDREFMVSVLFCRRKCKHGTLVWALEPAPGERDYITLVCTMNTTHDRVISYFVLPNMAPFKSKGLGDGRLKRGHQLNSLTELYSTVRQLWAARLRTVRVCRSTFP